MVFDKPGFYQGELKYPLKVQHHGIDTLFLNVLLFYDKNEIYIVLLSDASVSLEKWPFVVSETIKTLIYLGKKKIIDYGYGKTKFNYLSKKNQFQIRSSLPLKFCIDSTSKNEYEFTTCVLSK